MCKFYSFFLGADGRIYDKFPYESHSDVQNYPADAVPLETVTNEQGDILIDTAQHPVPAWFTYEHLQAIRQRQAERLAELEQWGQTARARKQHAKVLADLRRMFPDAEARALVIERAGAGTPETALRHIQHTRQERTAQRERVDDLAEIKRKCALVWLSQLSDDYIRRKLDAANYRAQCRTLSLRDIKTAIAATVEDGKSRKVGGWSVANAYRKFGRPAGTFAHIDPAAHTPLQIFRSEF